MPVEFRITQHSIYPERKVVEILEDGKVIGVIYPSGEKEIKIVSAHIEELNIEKDFAGEVIENNGSTSWPPIPFLLIRFKPSPYVIQGNRIVKIPVH